MAGLVSAMGAKNIGWGYVNMSMAVNVPRALARGGHLSALLDHGVVPVLLRRMCDSDGQLGRNEWDVRGLRGMPVDYVKGMVARRCIETIWLISRQHTHKLAEYEALPAAVCQTLVGFVTGEVTMREEEYRDMAAEILVEIVKYGDEQVSAGKTHSNLMADRIAQLDCFQRLKRLMDAGHLWYTTDDDDHPVVRLVSAVASKASASVCAGSASSGGSRASRRAQQRVEKKKMAKGAPAK